MKRIKNLAKFIILLSAMLCVGLLFGCKTNDKKGADLPTTQNYSVSYLAGEGGSVSGALTQTVEHGEDCEEVVAKPDVGYKFAKWSDGVTTAERTDKNITADKSVTAVFEKRICVVRYEADKNGSIEGKVTQTVAYDESATKVTAKPNEGYKFVKWSDGVTTAERADKNITASKSVKAIFEKQKFNVSYITDGNGRIEGGATQTVAYNESAATVTAIPNEGYKFIKWSDGIVTAGRTDAYVKSDKTLEAKFEKKKYTLSYKTDGHGYIRGKRNQRVEYGDSAEKVTAIPDNGYKFVKWSDGVTENERQDLNVKKSVEITAEFEFLFAGGKGYTYDPFIIENYQQFKNMRLYRGSNYTLANDLDLSGINHEPIFDKDNPFYGNFDGNGKTIDNLTVTSEKNYPSLFGYISRGIVANLKLQNVDIKTTDFNTEAAGKKYFVGTVAGYSEGTLKDLSVTGKITVDGLTYDGAVVGGLVGSANSSHITFCDVDVRITARNIIREHSTGSERPFMLGGIAGVCVSVNIMDSAVRGEINISNCCDNILVGGLVDWYTVKYNGNKITRCQTNVAITSDNKNHKLAGFIEFLGVLADSSFEVVKCSVIGNITGGGVGGFIHTCDASGDLLIENCFVKNEINECTHAAGFVYEIIGYKCTIRYSYANSKIKTYNQSGIACGFAYSLRNINLINCNSSGSVSATRCYGFSCYLLRCHIERCYSDSDIEAVYNSPAFSFALMNSEIINCYSQNKFINEPQQNNENIPLVMILGVRESIIRNFYYSGNSIEKVFKTVSDSEITNFHCLKNENMTGELTGGNTSSTIDITVYENKEEMYGITDKLNDGLSEVVWRNVPKNFPKLNVI